MMLFVDIFLPAMGLLMLIVGVLEKRSAKRDRRQMVEMWRDELDRETRVGR